MFEKNPNEGSIVNNCKFDKSVDLSGEIRELFHRIQNESDPIEKAKLSVERGELMIKLKEEQIKVERDPIIVEAIKKDIANTQKYIEINRQILEGKRDDQ